MKGQNDQVLLVIDLTKGTALNIWIHVHFKYIFQDEILKTHTKKLKNCNFGVDTMQLQHCVSLEPFYLMESSVPFVIILGKIAPITTVQHFWIPKHFWILDHGKIR
ncbi:hypothetical protein ACJX0J_013766, partial [Zea mays]